MHILAIVARNIRSKSFGGNEYYINIAIRKKKISGIPLSLRPCLLRNEINVGELYGGYLCSASSVFDKLPELLFCHFPSGCYIRLRENKMICKIESCSLCLLLPFLVIFQIMPPKGDIISPSVHILKKFLRGGPLKK